MGRIQQINTARRITDENREFTDALRVFEVQCEHLDLDYLNRWAGDLGLQDLWTRLQNEAEII